MAPNGVPTKLGRIVSVDRYWPALFEAMLEGWVTDESMWPTKRNFQMFGEWFEMQMTSMVVDLDLDEPLQYDEQRPPRCEGAQAG